VNEQEQPAGAGPGEQPAQPAPAPAPPARSRGASVRRVVTSRSAGWVVATAMTGAVVALSVVLATSPAGVAGPVAVRLAPGAMRTIHLSPAGVQVVSPCKIVGPARVQVTVPGMAVSGPVATWVAAPQWMTVGPAGRVVVTSPGGILRAPIAAIPAGATLTTPFGETVTGTVASTSKSGFTLTSGSRTVTVTGQPGTFYRKGGSPAAAGAVTRGATVAVLGTQHGSAISAIEVVVLSS
jgi:hypothetical protein